MKGLRRWVISGENLNPWTYNDEDMPNQLHLESLESTHPYFFFLNFKMSAKGTTPFWPQPA